MKNVIFILLSFMFLAGCTGDEESLTEYDLLGSVWRSEDISGYPLEIIFSSSLNLMLAQYVIYDDGGVGSTGGSYYYTCEYFSDGRIRIKSESINSGGNYESIGGVINSFRGNIDKNGKSMTVDFYRNNYGYQEEVIRANLKFVKVDKSILEPWK